NTDTAIINSYYNAWQKRLRKLKIDTTSLLEGYSLPEGDFRNRESISYEQSTNSNVIHIHGKDNTFKLDRFNVWINETPLFGQNGINLRKRNLNRFDTTLTVILSDGNNILETGFKNVNGVDSYRIPLTVNYTPAKPHEEKVYF